MPIHHYALSSTYYYCCVRERRVRSEVMNGIALECCHTYNIYSAAIIYKTNRVSAVRLMKRIPFTRAHRLRLYCRGVHVCVRIWMIKANPIEVRSCHTVRMEAFVHVSCKCACIFLFLHAHRIPLLRLFLLLLQSSWVWVLVYVCA